MKIKVKNKIIFETFHHYVLETDLDSFEFKDNELLCERISKDNIDQVGSAVGNTTRKWVMSEYPYAEGYCFRNEDGDIVGSCWMMLKGGDEKLYKVRKCDVFMFRLEVLESFRGKKYSKKIMNNIYRMAKDKGCEKVRFVTATKNAIAIHLHESLGAKIIGERFFVRVFNRNIPYYSV